MTTERIEELRKQFMNSSDRRIREMLYELDRQRQRIAELEAALRPFADIAEEVKQVIGKGPVIGYHDIYLYVDEFDNARKALGEK